MAPKPDVSVERKQQILAAATRVFAQCGIEAARMAAIAREAGLSIGGLYWYFKSKEEIVFELVRSIIEPDLAQARAVLLAPGSARRRLEALLAANFDETAAFLPVTLDVYRQSVHSPTVRRYLQDYFSGYQEVIGALLAQGIAGGEFRPLDTAQAASALIALYEGFMELTLLDWGEDSPDPRRGAAAFAAALALFLDGLASPDTQSTRQRSAAT